MFGKYAKERRYIRRVQKIEEQLKHFIQDCDAEFGQDFGKHHLPRILASNLKPEAKVYLVRELNKSLENLHTLIEGEQEMNKQASQLFEMRRKSDGPDVKIATSR